tara:strand:+ start:784 stop:954 length:171 start_codon:yes stop_codon:yes gene_type:complete
MSIVDSLIDSVMKKLGISKNMIDKAKTIIDNIDVQEVDDKIYVTIKVKNITLIVEK